MKYEIGSEEWEEEMDKKSETFFRVITGQTEENDQEIADEVSEIMKKAAEIM